MGVGDVSKRILLGRKLRSTQLGETLLPKRVALPVFASDALSSVAYAPDEIFIMLSFAGVAAYAWSWKIGLLVALVMLTVVASYRQNVHAYPSGGGDYEVATVNLGQNAGVTVASALLVDYVLTVAVSISSGAQNAAAALSFISGNEALVASASCCCSRRSTSAVCASRARSSRSRRTASCSPSSACAPGASCGCCRGRCPTRRAPSLRIIEAEGYEGTDTVALVFLLARAFSSGCAALTGVEAISNGVPAFRKPKSRNAATTLLLLGLIAITMMLSVTLANRMHLRYVDPHDFERLILPSGEPVPPGYDQHTVIAQIARGVFDNFSPGFYFVIAMTGIILVLAANTAFNGFPVLGSILAKDGLLPRQLAHAATGWPTATAS